MNKLMWEIAEQNMDQGPGYHHYDPVFLKNYTEAIVKECLSVVKSNTYGPAGEYDYSYSEKNAAADDRAETIYDEIVHRFGVEE